MGQNDYSEGKRAIYDACVPVKWPKRLLAAFCVWRRGSVRGAVHSRFRLFIDNNRRGLLDAGISLAFLAVVYCVAIARAIKCGFGVFISFLSEFYQRNKFYQRTGQGRCI
jgi:hypothetical protein